MAFQSPGTPRLPDPPKEWASAFMQEYSRVLTNWLIRVGAESDTEAGETAIKHVTADTTMGPADGTLLVDTTTGNVLITLPDATTVPGREFTVKKLVAANTVTVGAAAGNIDDVATLAFTVRYTAYTLKSDGVDYWII